MTAPLAGPGGLGAAGEPRFVADINVGRLAKWLRALGYDVLEPPDFDDGALVRLALREDRTLLTRDARLCARRVFVTGQARCILVRHDQLAPQLRQVIATLGLATDRAFTRCIVCNVPLVGLEAEAARIRVPPYVFATQGRFRACPRCDRVFWRGTHWDRMRRVLEGTEVSPR